jgi:hypothetical protein
MSPTSKNQVGEGEESQARNMFNTGINERVEATGELLYHIHSTYFRGLLCKAEETSLQFYEHVGELAIVDIELYTLTWMMLAHFFYIIVLIISHFVTINTYSQ